MPSTPPAAPPHELRPPARIWKPLPLAGGLVLLYACTYLILAAVSVIYLPLRIAELEPGGKAGALAAVSTATALLVMVGQPVIGALSDRTRSRWGRRAPWMLAGALASALALPVLGAADGLLLLGIAAAANELALNAVLAPAAAVVVDRVPVSRRGLASAASGTGFLVGSAAGALVVGAAMAGAAPLLALLVPAAVAVFVLLNPDRPEQHAPRRTVRRILPPAGAAAAARNLAADLLRHPDFLRVFAGRFLLALTYSLVATYLLYLLEDYLGLSAGEAAAFAGLVLVVVLASSAPAMWIGALASDRIRRRKPFAAGSAALMAAVLAIPLLFPSRGAVLVFAVLFGLGFGVFNAVGDALATQVLPQGRERAGRDLGVLNIAAALPQVAAPAIGWAAVSLTGGYAVLFMLGICAAAAGTWAVTGVRSVR